MRADARNPRVVIPSNSRGDKYLHEIRFKKNKKRISKVLKDSSRGENDASAALNICSAVNGGFQLFSRVICRGMTCSERLYCSV